MKCSSYRFGPFEFDIEKLELRRQGAIVNLQSQPGRVLAYLVQNAGRTVSREELRKVIWGDETFVDFERGLNFCISQLRSAINDDSARPVYIRTLPKRGYQFIAATESTLSESSRGEHRVGLPPHVGNRRAALVGALVLSLSAGTLAAFWSLRNADSRRPPVIAVVRFDNETGNPEVTRFSDALTDDIVERLTTFSSGRYRVIGNGQVLRLPREHRDLNAIAKSLHARFIVLGQVRSNGSQTRILAHLIRMPDQTHVWVARMDRPLSDPFKLESEVAQEIATQFSARVTNGTVNGSLPSAANR
jgi:TolB-like protein/DNA-binding winged helix-turn-helix (wHTH) protein